MIKLTKKAALYIRVSTHHQIDKDSLPYQRKDLINYVKYALNIEEYEVFVDAGYSAKNTARPDYQNMMDRIRKGEFTHLVVWKIDRISRNLKDFIEMYEGLKKYDVTFVSKNEQFDTSTAMGEAMLKIILVFAELERKLAAERVSAIMISRAEQGLWNGATVPLGFKWDEEIEYPAPYQSEVQVVQYIFDSYLKLGSTLKVAAKLNEENIPTKRDGRWQAKTIRDVLRNTFYIGTYTYNKRDNSDDKYSFKDEDEWIVKKNNHKAIIDNEIFQKANDMLSENYRGLNSIRRENTNIHIFAKKLYCGKCGGLLTSGLDNARKDGYQPSRYTCSSYHYQGVEHYCNNFISDIVIGPFLINYIANLIRIQDNIDENFTPRELEKSLLRGSVFNDVVGINDSSLSDTMLMFASGVTSEEYLNDSNNVEDIRNIEYDKLLREKEKFEKALVRLEDLYLFDDADMSKKDFIIRKNKIEEKLEDILNKIDKTIDKSTSMNNQVFVDKTKYFLITKELQQKRKIIDFRNLVDTIGNELLSNFVNSVISEVVVLDKQVHSVEFKNGITHEFVHKPSEKAEYAINYNYPVNGAYRQHFDQVLEYVKNNGSVTRTEVEKIAGIKRYSALTLLNELIAMDKLERKRDSVAIKYCLKE